MNSKSNICYINIKAKANYENLNELDLFDLEEVQSND